MRTRWTVFLLFVLLVAASVSRAVEFPAAVAASKCKGKKKVFGYLDEPGTGVRKFKMPNSFYVQSGSIYLQGCRSPKGSSECVETFGLGLFPGTGEMPCGGSSGLPYVTYSLMPEGGVPVYWSNTGECLVTVTKYDEENGRLKGYYETEVTGGAGPAPVMGRMIGCFSARRQDIGPLD
jgi:hypothetical protein